ncbi:MAG: aspartyl/glutamyl-tRNA amidotransferase subunit C [Candidatus Pacebacteria bacterium]|nr:aspartyl/glutamyl-tRNA amidotransferase subunit C [Candidatus Paceibacterota bacterium]
MDIKTIDYLADLARLGIDANEKEAMVKDLGGVLAYVDQIRGIANNLGDIEPEYLKINIAAHDEPMHVGGQYSDAILNEAPGRETDYVVVKKVL